MVLVFSIIGVWLLADIVKLVSTKRGYQKA